MATKKRAPVTPQPSCPTHPKGHVTRAGTYKRTGRKWQMYRCDPGNGGDGHRFTPPLPRAVVPLGEACQQCENALGVHQGNQAAARTFQADGHLVARVVARIGRGDSYGKTGLRARRTLGKDTEGLPGANGWRLAADWTEVFVPPLWNTWDTQQRDQMLTPLAASRTSLVIVIDDVPLFNRATDDAKGGRQRFAVLALGVSASTGTW